MSSTDAEAGGGAPRRRDAGATRDALMHAAAALFDERGYRAATVRDVGLRAGVDPALIARYFGGKEGLYLAVLERSPRPPTEPHAVVERLLRRLERPGDAPVSLALVGPGLSPHGRAEAARSIHERLVAPLSERLERAGCADARLRAEVLVAAAVGVALARGTGGLPRLADASVEAVQALLDPLIDGLCAPGGASEPR